MTITIRPATTDDARALSVIGAASFLDAFIEVIPGPDLVSHCLIQHGQAAYEAYLADPDPRTAAWIAEYAETGAPVGYALTCPPDLPVPDKDGDVELKRIYLLSRFHGTGTGHALMQMALDHAAHLGAPRLLLGVYEHNTRAIAFYRRNGFETIGARRFQVGGRLFDDIVMSCNL